MNNLFFVIILIFLCMNSFGQKKSKFPEHEGPPTAKDDSIMTENYKCTYRNTYSPKERLAFYPFNRAKRVILISYDDSSRFENTTPITGKKIDYSKVKERVTLNDLQLDSLTSILYNVGVKSTDYWLQIADPGRSCYNPRNSVMFLNDQEEIIDYIEICFECHREELSSERIKSWKSCETKYELLQDYFLSTGMKIGTKREND